MSSWVQLGELIGSILLVLVWAVCIIVIAAVALVAILIVIVIVQALVQSIRDRNAPAASANAEPVTNRAVVSLRDFLPKRKPPRDGSEVSR